MYRDTSIKDKSRQWKSKDRFRESDLERVTWKDLAKEYGVRYHRQINVDAFSAAFGGNWPRFMLGPEEGTLDSPLLEKLGNILSGHTTDSRWLFEYYLVATFDIQSDELFVGGQSDLPTANDQAKCGAGPTYWWPADRAWCVCSDYDLAFTVVGTTRAALADLANSDDLEGFEMRLTDRIDYKSYTQRD
ncbi:MAG: hypothetical protein AAF680_00135 [Pseudomonadota bacterium]